MSDAEMGITVPAPFDARPRAGGLDTYEAVMLHMEVVARGGSRTLLIDRGGVRVARFNLTELAAAHLAMLLTKPAEG